MVEAGNRTVRELAVEIQGAARVFEKLGIDYCCGGDLPLSEACAKTQVSVEEVLSLLGEAQPEPSQSSDWAEAPLERLARHIVEKHHTFTRVETARLESLFVKVCNAHGERHPELEDMQLTFCAMASELRTHMMKEEHILFPYLATMEQAILQKRSLPSAMFGSVGNPVRNMMQEHDSAGEGLRSLRKASRDYTPPEDACVSFRELYRSLAAFESDLHTHIHLENNILFPRALALEAAAD